METCRSLCEDVKGEIEGGSARRRVREGSSKMGLVVEMARCMGGGRVRGKETTAVTSRLRCIGKKKSRDLGQRGERRVGPLLGWSDERHHGILNVSDCPWISLTSSWVFLARGRSQTAGRELSSRDVRARGPPLMIKFRILQPVSHKNHIYRVTYLCRLFFTFIADEKIRFHFWS